MTTIDKLLKETQSFRNCSKTIEKTQNDQPPEVSFLNISFFSKLLWDQDKRIPHIWSFLPEPDAIGYLSALMFIVVALRNSKLFTNRYVWIWFIFTQLFIVLVAEFHGKMNRNVENRQLKPIIYSKEWVNDRLSYHEKHRVSVNTQFRFSIVDGNQVHSHIEGRYVSHLLCISSRMATSNREVHLNEEGVE